MFQLIISVHLLVAIYANKSAVSYNQPKLCSDAKWSPNATTFADCSVLKNPPRGIFINKENNVYVAALGEHKIMIWLNKSASQPHPLEFEVGHDPYSIFVTNTDDIYVESADKKVSKWKLNESQSMKLISFSDRCFGLFVDLNDSSYCSVQSQHVVEKISLLNESNTTQSTVAGKYQKGSSSDMLQEPHGIFVDTNFNLYVADCGNNRIQRFEPGQTNGTTVAGNNSLNAENLNCPTGVILDSDNNLYIVDRSNRVVKSQQNSLRCLIGCNEGVGSTPNLLDNPFSLAFDSYGNIFVTEVNKNRIQKFVLISNSCNSTDPNGMNSNNNTSIIGTPNQTMISYHLPNFCSLPSWNPNAITFANTPAITAYPYGIFVDFKNTVYILGEQPGQVTVWPEGMNISTKTLFGNLSFPHSLFVAFNGDIYVDNGVNGEVVMWKSNETNSSLVMNVNESCYGLFIDLRNNLYCSVEKSNQIVKKSLNNESSILEIIAGIGASRSMNNSLSAPHGIFIDTNFDLYVADGNNHRIICIYSDTLTDKVVAGAGAPNTITLNYPTGVTLDANSYLYIVDQGNHRLVGSGPYGFRCLVGCSGSNGCAANQFVSPWTMQFDRQGNMFVTDRDNTRVQKFLLSTNSCALSYNQPKFCLYPTWNSTGSTVLNHSTPGFYAKNIFVDNNNNLYVIDNQVNHIHVWSLHEAKWIINNISADASDIVSLFATATGQIYVASTNKLQVVKWTSNETATQNMTIIEANCTGLFIDVNNFLYCSMGSQNKVVKKSLLSNLNNLTTVAGDGSSGVAPHLLSSPHGIFVDVHLTLFVADGGNDRIQRFELNRLNGTTVAGNGSKDATIILKRPTGVVLDADGNLFIVDHDQHRIVLSGPNGSRCIIGCDRNDSISTRLSNPTTMSFDTYGNIIVVEEESERIKKFSLASNSCDLAYITTTEYTSLSTTQTITSTESSTSMTTLNIVTTDPESSTSTVTLTTAITDSESSTSTVTLSAVVTDSRSSTNEVILTTVIADSTSSTMMSTTKIRSKEQSFVFLPQQCDNASTIGVNCTIPNTQCNNLKPCQNNATCQDTVDDYICMCSEHFTGIHCEVDQRICKQYHCFNHGICNERFDCQCNDGWQGKHCESKVNFCENVTCQNNGVCRSILKNYTCDCLGDHYYGRHCENTAKKMMIYKIVSKSFAYVAIIAMACVAMFVLIMDILKYCFGIDPVEGERQRLRREKQAKKPKPPVVERCVYVNAPPIDNKKTDISAC